MQACKGGLPTLPAAKAEVQSEQSWDTCATYGYRQNELLGLPEEGLVEPTQVGIDLVKVLQRRPERTVSPSCHMNTDEAI